MAIRQYIGARYVPKFYQGSNGNEWDSGVVYEALTMVTYLGSTYCSKKPVPARTVAPNLDTEYWVLTAAYSSQVAELREEVEGVEEDVETLQTDVSSLKTRTTNLERSVNKKYIFIGDSYGVLEDNWIDMVVDLLDLSSSDYYKVARNSYGFRGDPSVSGSSFLNLLTEYAPSITNKNDITDIVVGGGINDCYDPYSPATIGGAIEQFCAYCKTNYPNAKIHIGYISYTNNTSWLLRQPGIIREYNSAAQHCGYAVMDNIYNAFHYPNWLTDSVHPNADGMQKIANAIASHLLGGSSIGIPAYLSFYYTGIGILANKTLETFETFDGRTFTVYCDQTQWDVSGSFTCNDGWQNLFNLPSDSFIVGTGRNIVNANVSLYSTTENVYYKIPCEFRIVGRVVQIRCPYKGASGTSDKVIAVTQFKIPALSFTLPGMYN